MKIIAVGYCALVVAFGVSGCATVRPPLIDDKVLPLSALTQAINCELTNTIAENIKDNPWLLKWQGQYVITLKANQVGYLKATANTFPIVLPRSSMLNFGVGGGVTGTANRTAIFKYNIKFVELAKNPPCQPMLRPDGHPFLAGEIGFKEWMARAIQTADDPTGKVKPEQLSSIGHTFEFILDLSAGISPSFVLMPAPPILLNPTANFERVEDNIVDVSFGKLPAEAATVADLARILSKSQEQEKAKAEATKRASIKTIETAEQQLSQPSSKALIELDARIPALQSQLQELQAPTIQSETGKVAESVVAKQLQAAKQEQAKKAAEIDALKRQKLALDRASVSLEAAERKISQIESDPKGTRVIQRAVPFNAPSPDSNPNVTGTLLQLQLERLVGSSPLRQ